MIIGETKWNNWMNYLEITLKMELIEFGLHARCLVLILDAQRFETCPKVLSHIGATTWVPTCMILGAASDKFLPYFCGISLVNYCLYGMCLSDSKASWRELTWVGRNIINWIFLPSKTYFGYLARICWVLEPKECFYRWDTTCGNS